MLISKRALAKIKDLVANHYQGLLINVTGKQVFTPEEITELRGAGVDTRNDVSMLSLIYHNNFLNSPNDIEAPISVEEMAQQQAMGVGDEYQAAVAENLNENMRQLVEKLQAGTQAQIEGLVREYNYLHRNDLLDNEDRSKEIAKLIKESTVGGLKQKLKEISGDASRDWQRVAITEVSNALGLGSVDRIVEQNPGKKLKEIYVYRIPVGDAHVCKYCKAFYLDNDGSPAVYRLATILGNGTNFGKKAIEWKPVGGATHPNERCSGLLELRPGWRVVTGGKVEYIGRDAWQDYIEGKVRS